MWPWLHFLPSWFNLCGGTVRRGYPILATQRGRFRTSHFVLVLVRCTRDNKCRTACDLGPLDNVILQPRAKRPVRATNVLSCICRLAHAGMDYVKATKPPHLLSQPPSVLTRNRRYRRYDSKLDTTRFSPDHITGHIANPSAAARS